MAQAAVMKGIRGSIRRAATIPLRYGASSSRLRRRLEGLTALCDRWEITPTIPVTAVALERHPEVAAALSEVDVAVHGYRHVAYSELLPEEQAADLDAAMHVFVQRGFTARGFRAPYLQSNGTTLKLLRSRRFLFDSSMPEPAISPGTPLGARISAAIRSRYGAVPGRIPRGYAELGLIEVPVSLPDDEILVDALGVRNPSALWRVFEEMLAFAKHNSSMLVLQIHPERYHICEDALELALQRASDEGAWRASLTEAAEWLAREGGFSRHWPGASPYAIAITGDLDAVALVDFAHRFVGE